VLLCVTFALAATSAGTDPTGDTGVPASDTGSTLTGTVSTGDTGGTTETVGTTDTGVPEEEEVVEEEVVVSAAALAGEVGGVRCDSVGVAPFAGWLVLLLAAVRRARGVS
jgi:uncharacterized protein (TIGR03382 family)